MIAVLNCMPLFFALPGLAQTSASGAYDFYWESVKKGSCKYALEDGLLTISSNPGYAAGAEATIDLDGSRIKKIEFRPDGKQPVEYAADSNGLSASGKTMPDHTFYPSFPILLQDLLSTYDSQKGGFQDLACLDLAKGNERHIQAQLFRTESRQLGAYKQRLREWRIESAPNPEAVLWTDEHNLPLYWWMPKLNYEIVRRGFDELRPAFRFANSVSPPRFEMKVEKDVPVAMRDGAQLKADVYRPAAEGKFPVILQRTCYDRTEFGNADGEFYAQRGYVYVTQHVRGRGDSEGSFEPLIHEAEDGFDSVRWCGTQPWSSGKVGMIGASYNGFCTWMAAKTRPKWLKTIIPVVAMAGPPKGAFWAGGVFYMSSDLGWFGLLRDKAKVQPYNDDLTKAMNTLPLSKADEVQFGHDVAAFDRPLKADAMDAYIKQGAYCDDLKQIDLPVLYLDGWLNPTSISTKQNYLAMAASHRQNQKLIWGPWDHFTNQESKVGLTDFGPDGYFDMRTTCLRWFDRWLKGMPNGIDKEPRVTYFILGENRWHQTNRWPPREMKPQRWYLNDGGALALSRPKESRPSDYRYDPSEYIYSDKNNSGYFFQIGDDAAYLCRRKGQLIFDSAPLEKPLTLNGPVRAKLYASTNAKDTDWVAVLIDRHPDGICIPLATGYVRARYRDSFVKPTLLKPGRVYGYDIDLWQTGIRIDAGHRLRIVVCSTLFPDTDRNLNTGEPVFDATRIVVASQKIYHDPKRASYVELPVVTPAIG